MTPMLKRFIRWLLKILYGYRTFGEEVLRTPGPVLLLPNHSSWWDWLLIGVCLEDDWRFVTSSVTAELSWVHRRMMVNRRTFPINMSSPYAAKHMAEYLHKGGRLVLFPEGRLSLTGSLMKFFEGTGFLIHRSQPKVVACYLRGTQRLPFGPNPDKRDWFPRLSAHFSPVLTPPGVEHMSASVARHKLTDWLRDQMVRQQFEVEMEFGARTVPEAIFETACRHRGTTVLQDVSFKQLTYRRLLAGSELLGRVLAQDIAPGNSRVGLLLPNVGAFPVALLGLWREGKVPAILNYTTGLATMLTCARVAGLREIVTSRRFAEQAKLDTVAFGDTGLKLIYLEDLSQRIGSMDKLGALFRASLAKPEKNVFHGAEQSEKSGVILFTSGSEGEPKAVDLTHRNLLANVRQMLGMIDLTEEDRLFNALPLFHSFGLTIGLLLPLIRGIRTFLYLSPLHYRAVPSVVYDSACTVLFGTNTFLSGYARKAHPYDFRSVRYVFAGAEKLQESTARIWMQKFGVRILEGYGATECSPCVSVNTPMRPLAGSAGQFLPGVEHRIEPVEGVSEGGRLLVRGANIMRGYLNPEPNAKFQAMDGWYDTGDIVKVDEDGFLHILGRLKRFAKISGEMVSLGAVEDALAAAFPQYGPKFCVAVISAPDENKGERLVAVTNEPRLSLEQVREAVRSKGLSNLAAPREIRVVHDFPLLGTGKVNYRELQRMAAG
jgi:acyl-[acyl-carrier-protein]-phospholipid O-acyltransferase/long-chain-fatty-acid--[acyl-carrier-protein] ligase